MTELVEGLHVVQRDTGKASLWPTEHTLTVVPGTGVGESTVETLQDRRALAYINCKKGKRETYKNHNDGVGT